jgi:transcription antitermination factor NusG
VFPGYVFCRFDVLNRLPILKTPGVAHVVGIGRAPHPLDEQEVQSLRVLVGSELPVDPWPFVQVGQRIDIVGGPLAGASGLLLHVKGKDRLVVSISLLQRSVAVEVPQGCAWPATA